MTPEDAFEEILDLDYTYIHGEPYTAEMEQKRKDLLNYLGWDEDMHYDHTKEV